MGECGGGCPVLDMSTDGFVAWYYSHDEILKVNDIDEVRS